MALVGDTILMSGKKYIVSAITDERCYLFSADLPIQNFSLLWRDIDVTRFEVVTG